METMLFCKTSREDVVIYPNNIDVLIALQMMKASHMRYIEPLHASTICTNQFLLLKKKKKNVKTK
jgi:hypothetical protein